MSQRSLAAGEYVFRRGDDSTEAYVVEEGQIELVGEDGSAQIRIALLGPGELFGEMGLIEERPRRLSARALRPSRLAVLGRDAFVERVLEPRAGLQYLRQVFERLGAMNGRVVRAEGAALPPLPPRAPEVVVRLFAASEAAGGVLPEAGLVLGLLPFRVGRLSERHADPTANELELPDQAPFTVSRHHFAIDRDGPRVFVQDRGSHLGTLVNGACIGGRQAAAEADLAPGDNLVAPGGPGSRYRFRVVLETTA